MIGGILTLAAIVLRLFQLVNWAEALEKRREGRRKTKEIADVPLTDDEWKAKADRGEL